MKPQITLGSLFDGIGGFPYAASFYGIKTVWASEILPCAVAVTRRHFPDMIHAGDITKLSGELLPPVDIITFGSPCQDLSVAKGHRDGLDGSRSGLFTEAIRIIKEMRKSTNGKYPRYAVWENVPGALHSRHGSDYKTVLEAFTDCEISMPPSGRWASAGMVRGRSVDLAWCVYNAAEFGLAQRRKRVFLVADFRGTSAGKILFIPKGLPRHFAEGGAQGESPAAAPAGSSDGADTNCLNPWDTQQKRVYTENGTAPTLTGADGGGGRNPAGLVMRSSDKCGINGNIAGTLDANYGKGPGMRGGVEREIVVSAFGETGRGYWQPGVQTIRATGENHPGSPSHVVAAFIGKASPGAGTVGYSETEAPTLRAGMTHCVCEPDIARTLTARGDSSPCADRGQNIVCMATTQANAEICENLCPTITEAAGKSGNNKPYVVHPDKAGTLCGSGAGLSRPAGMCNETELCVAYCLQGNMIGREDGNGPQGGGVNEEISFTLNTTDRHAVAAPENPNDRLCGTICAKTAAPNGIGNEVDLCILEKPVCHYEFRGFGEYAESETSKTILARDNTAACDVVAVDCRNIKEIGTQSSTLQAKNTPGYSLNYQNPVRIGYTVRRLTPTECERLQGFPDGWTEYGISPEDYELYKKSIKRGIQRTGLPEDVVLQKISDSKRYQMLGNSVAIPCVAHIMRGIAEEMEETV